jgi:hypothetical protein
LGYWGEQNGLSESRVNLELKSVFGQEALSKSLLVYCGDAAAVVCASVCWRASSFIDTRGVSLLQSRNAQIEGSSRVATKRRDLVRQTTICYDFSRLIETIGVHGSNYVGR